MKAICIFLMSILLLASPVRAAGQGAVPSAQEKDVCDFSAMPQLNSGLDRASVAADEWAAMNSAKKDKLQELEKVRQRGVANPGSAHSAFTSSLFNVLGYFVALSAVDKLLDQTYPLGRCFERGLDDPGTRFEIFGGAEITVFETDDLAVVYRESSREDALYFALPKSRVIYDRKTDELVMFSDKTKKWEPVAPEARRFWDLQIIKASALFRLQ